MSIRLILGLLFILPFFSNAQQTATLEWGTEFDFRRGADFNTVVGVKDENIFVLSSSGLRPENSIDVDLDVYDANTLEFKKGLSLIENRSDENFEKAVISADKLLIFSSYFDRQLDIKVLSLREYDVETNTLSEAQRVDEVHLFQKDVIVPFNIASSPNGNYVLIYHDNPSDNGNKVFNLKVINYDYTSLWEKEIVLNYKDKMVDFTDIRIDDAANVYLLSSINPFGLSKMSAIGALVNIKNALFVYRPYEDKLKEYEFALSKNWIDEVVMDFDDEGSLVATAFYTYPNDYKIRGFVLFELETESGEVVARKMVTLDKNQFRKIDDSIDRLKDYSRMLVGSPGIYPGTSSHMNSTSTEFIMHDVFVYDQTIVIAMEAFRKDERCTESFSNQQMIVDCQKNFLYGDVILFFLDKDCQIKKIRQVEKMQHAVNRLNPYFSFDIVDQEDGLYVLYNDDYRNYRESRNPQKMALSNLNRAGMKIHAFDLGGSEKNLELMTNIEEDSPLFPHGNLSIGSSQLLLYSQSEKNYKFGKLSVH